MFLSVQNLWRRVQTVNTDYYLFKEGYQSIGLAFTIVVVFGIHLKGYSLVLKIYKKRLLHLGRKKGRVFFDLKCAAKNSKAPCDMWRYSCCHHLSCNDKWSITTYLEKYSFLSLLPLVVYGRRGTPPALQLRWRHLEYHHKGCSKQSHNTLLIWFVRAWSELWTLLARSCFKFPKSRYSVLNIEQVNLT